MIFYFRSSSHYGRSVCYGVEFPTRREFLRYMEGAYWRTEVPISCVKKLFGHTGWLGGEYWPLDKQPTDGYDEGKGAIQNEQHQGR